MNKLDIDYQNLLKDILKNGTIKEDRTGTGTISVFGRQIRHKMSDGFPLLTTKKMYTKGIITELLWFLRGDTNIKFLIDNGCHIWDGDAYKYYLKNFIVPECPPELDVQPSYYEPMSKELFVKSIAEKNSRGNEFSEKWGELGPIYGAQWRNWNNEIDQIENLINDLKTNPDSRRLMVSAWNPSDLPNQTLPPCHYGFQVYTKELRLKERINIAIESNLTTSTAHLSEEDYWKWCDKNNIPSRALSLMWNQRSCDFPLGIPYNIASYGLLLTIISKQVNMVPDELIGNLGDCHIYKNQIDGCVEQLTRSGYDLPNMIVSNKEVSDISEYTLDDLKIENYTSHPTIKFPLSN